MTTRSTGADETTSANGTPSLVLTPPEAISPVNPRQALRSTPLPSELAVAVDAQVDRFLATLLAEDLQSDAFRARLDSAFRLGREEIAVTAALMSGPFMQHSSSGLEDSAAFRAIREMRKHLDALDPGKEGDLLTPNKLFGFIPLGNKLKAYFRRFQSAGQQIQVVMRQIYAARDDLQRDDIALEATRVKLWEAMQRLKAAIHFAERLDGQLGRKVSELVGSEPERAKALEQEVLYHVRQNLQDMLTQMAVCVNGYLSLDALRKTCRELINGCDRVATTGMSALAVAQTVARATGNQVRVMDMLSGVNSAIENMMAETGKQLNAHVERTTAFAGNPLMGMDRLKEMFDLTFKAMDTVDNFRSKAVEAMAANNALMREQLAKAESYVDQARRQQIHTLPDTPVDGPVRL